MRERILNILKKSSDISDYRINTVKTQSYEAFFVHETLETVRSTDTEEIKVTVYVKHGDFLGDSTFPVYASYTDGEIEKAVRDGAKKAAVIDNPTYGLPAEGAAEFGGDSNLADFSSSELAAKIADAIFGASSYKDGSINALEIFLYRDEVSVINSRGTDKTEIRWHAMIEAIPTWNTEGESVEIYEDYRFTEFDAEAIAKEIDGKMQEVRDRCFAKKPEKEIDCNVVIGTLEAAELLFSLADELNYASVYNHTNAFEKGAPIQKEPTGDRLNVTLRGRIKGAVRSASFDADGTAMTDRKIMEDGIASDYYGGSRFAQYLGLKPTGNLPCLEAEPGTLTAEELASEPYFECVSMSGLQLDIYNDYIGGEVRLAYYFDGEKKIPLTGVSISGKLSDALSGMRLSESLAVRGGYRGPDKILFKTVKIV